jgi:hypothetical protein
MAALPPGVGLHGAFVGFVLGSDWSSVLATFADSSSVIKGYIRLVKSTGTTKFLVFRITSLASPIGYCCRLV